MAPNTSTLSANGSRNAPERVVPNRRARWPSTPSVTARAIQKRNGAPGRRLGQDHDQESRGQDQADQGDGVGRRDHGRGPEAVVDERGER